MALFEVWRDDMCLMSTEHEECIYPSETIASMQKAGLTVKYQGKRLKRVEKQKRGNANEN